MKTQEKLRAVPAIIEFYRRQLEKFKSIGLGNETEHGVVVTETVIKTTERRLKQLSLPAYLRSLNPYEA